MYAKVILLRSDIFATSGKSVEATKKKQTPRLIAPREACFSLPQQGKVSTKLTDEVLSMNLRLYRNGENEHFAPDEFPAKIIVPNRLQILRHKCLKDDKARRGRTTPCNEILPVGKVKFLQTKVFECKSEIAAQ